MPARTKIHIKDNTLLRAKLDSIYEHASQSCMAKWSVSLAKHVFCIADMNYKTMSSVNDGFHISELWQTGKSSVGEVRKASFVIHKLAKETDSELKKSALRTAGHAVACCHMKEHSMVASDYAIRVINLIYPNDSDAVAKERMWQITLLSGISNKLDCIKKDTP